MANYLRKNRADMIKAERKFGDLVKGKPKCPHCFSQHTVKVNEQRVCRNCQRTF
jgi:transposase-like protein